MKPLAYIGVDSARYRVLVPEQQVYLSRAEGPRDLCRDWTFENFFQANFQLAMNAKTAPKDGGCDKHDFRVTWADGHIYEGRYDLEGTEIFPSLQSHIWKEMIWMRDNSQASTLFGPGACDAARAFIETYDLGWPIVAPDDWEVIADYRVREDFGENDRKVQAAYGLPGHKAF
jgi:hypothetical protein